MMFHKPTFGADDEPINSEAPEPVTTQLWQQFAIADVVTRLVNSLSHINSQPTMDFESQYQAGYQAFADASAHLEQERQRAAAERLRIQRETSKEILDGQADLHRKRTKQFDDWNPRVPQLMGTR